MIQRTPTLEILAGQSLRYSRLEITCGNIQPIQNLQVTDQTNKTDSTNLVPGERSVGNMSVIENSDEELGVLNVAHLLHSCSEVSHSHPQSTSPVIDTSTVQTTDPDRFVASNSDILSTKPIPVNQAEVTPNADQLQQNAPPQQENQQAASSLEQPTSGPDDAVD